MRLVKYELKKLILNKFIILLFIILLCADIGFCIYQTSIQPYKIQQVEQIFKYYEKDPETIEKEYEKLKEIHSDYLENLDDDFYGNSTPPKELNTYGIYLNLFNRKEYIDNYKSDIERLIIESKKYLEEYKSIDVSDDSYKSEYLQKLIKIYSVNKNIPLTLEYTCGWDNLFSNSFIYNIFIILLVITSAPFMVLGDVSCGVHQIIYATKSGRLKIAVAKYAALIIFICMSTIVFLAIPLITYGFSIGYSSLDNFLQSFKTFEYCPYIITVGETLLINIIIKMFIFSVLGVIVMLFAQLLKKYTTSFILSLIFCSINYFLYIINYTNANNPFKLFNIFSITDTSYIFTRFRSINVFDNVLAYLPAIFIFYGLLLISNMIVGFILYSRTRGKISINKIKINIKLPSLHINCSAKSIFGYEMYKIIIANKKIIICIALIIIKFFMPLIEIEYPQSYDDIVYKQYMITLEGEVTDYKREYIGNERRTINKILSQYEIMKEKYANDEITKYEYKIYLSKYYNYLNKNEVLIKVENHLSYINTKSEEGIKAHFVYDTGWNKYFFEDFDYLLFILILILLTGIFNDEYKSGFCQILRSTKKGREKVFFSKLAVCISLALLLSILFNTIDIINISNEYYLPALNSPITSIEKFSTIDSNITIIQYLVISCAIKLTSFIILSIVILSFSVLLKNKLSIMSAVIFIVIFPYLFYKYGIEPLHYISITSLLSGNDYLLMSADANIINDLGLLILFLTVITVLSVILLKLSFNKYCKKG